MCAWYWNDLVRRNSVFSRSLMRVKGLSWSHATIPILQLVLVKFLVLLTCRELELHLHTVNLLGTIPHSHLRPQHTLHTCMSIGMSVDKSWAKHFRVQHRLLTMSLQRNLCRQFVCKRFNQRQTFCGYTCPVVWPTTCEKTFLITTTTNFKDLI